MTHNTYPFSIRPIGDQFEKIMTHVTYPWCTWAIHNPYLAMIHILLPSTRTISAGSMMPIILLLLPYNISSLRILMFFSNVTLIRVDTLFMAHTFRRDPYYGSSISISMIAWSLIGASASRIEDEWPMVHLRDNLQGARYHVSCSEFQAACMRAKQWQLVPHKDLHRFAPNGRT